MVLIVSGTNVCVLLTGLLKRGTLVGHPYYSIANETKFFCWSYSNRKVFILKSRSYSLFCTNSYGQSFVHAFVYTAYSDCIKFYSYKITQIF